MSKIIIIINNNPGKKTVHFVPRVQRHVGTDLLHGERRGDLLAPQDHGAMRQDLGQLIRVQPQEVGRPAESCPTQNMSPSVRTDTTTRGPRPVQFHGETDRKCQT